MWIFDNPSNSYPSAFIDSLAAVMDSGRISSPRGMETRELDHVSFCVDPRKTLFTSPIRNLNFFFLVAENLWYWSGRNSTELPSYYVKNYRNFSDESIHQGSYSPMLLEQIRYVVNTLKEDPNTRQAVIQLWRPNPSVSKDKPCTLSFDFKIRDGKLNMHATMRSNDALWGNNYDIPSFGLLQMAIAGIVGVEPGLLYLTAHSYHIYERHYKLAEELIKESWHYSKYPKDLELPLYVCDGLTQHMANLEELLGVHYMCKHNMTNGIQRNMNLPTFYEQFVYMMGLFEGQKYDDPRITNISINKLLEIGSPFGIIYHERNINKK